MKIKSPAEFFADNQNIAGFDNPGKSLYTTIRELVENSLDAAEVCLFVLFCLILFLSCLVLFCFCFVLVVVSTAQIDTWGDEMEENYK